MAISFTPNQVVSWDDLNALMGQHGSPQGAKSIQTIPWTKEQRAALEDRGLNPDDQNEVSPIVRYFFEDGSYLDAQIDAVGSRDGSNNAGQGSTFRIVEYKPSQKYQESQRPSAQTQVTADATPRIEGTPLPGGGFDNEQPIMVWRRPDGTVVKQEPLNAAERKKWDEDREKSRNPGGKTDAQVAQDQKDAEAKRPKETRTPVKDRPGYVEVTRVDPTTNTTETYYLGPDGQRTNNLPAVPKPATSSTVTVNGQTYIRHTVPKPDGTNEVYHTDQAGNRVELPQSGVSPGLPPELASWQPDPNKPAYGVTELVQTIQRLKAEGKLSGVTDAQLTDFVTSSRSNAQALASQNQAILSNAGTAYTHLVNQRNQQSAEQQNRSTLANSILERAQQTGLEISKYAKPGSGSAVTPYVAMGLGMQAAGYRDPGTVALPPALQAAYERNTFGGPPSAPAPAPAPAAPAAPPPPPMTREHAMANPAFRPGPMDPGNAPVPPAEEPQAMTLPPMLRGSFLAGDPRGSTLSRIFGPDLAAQALGVA